MQRSKTCLRLGMTALAALGGGLCIAAPGAALAADGTHGKALFQTCLSCHSEQAGALGPTLRGIYGRKSAMDENFRYSNAMTRANLIWDEGNLRDFVKDPQAKVKGNRMPYSGLSDPKDVDDLITYLKDYR